MGIKSRSVVAFLIFFIMCGCFAPYTAKAKTVIEPTVASGINVEKNDDCILDYSNTNHGYVMVMYKTMTTKDIKAKLVGPTGATYIYTLKRGRYEVVPLTDGSGTYTISILVNISGATYAFAMTHSFEAKLDNEFEPYIRPNQYVKYTKSTNAVKKAASLTKSCSSDLSKVKKVYKYIIKTFKYDKKKARNIKDGYVPNVSSLFKKKKGICFDYAAVMTAMLRSQGVPTKLIVGYTGKVYHAWINVFSKKKGWITGAIYFNGKKWKLMDPTYAATAKSSKSIMKYIGNAKNYKAEYSY